MKDMRTTVIILAGGAGTRLFPLTQNRSKPAVPIGGKFRLIDIPISNSLHAGFRHIWVVTQFASESLHRHIFTTYRLDSFAKGFISILAASQTPDNQSWYQGTADAVRKNLRFFGGAYHNILILSGDHLYRMDYREFVQYHNETEADLTIGVIPVDQSRVSELGVMKVDENFRIMEFFEKPKDPALQKQLQIPENIRAVLKGKFGVEPNKQFLASMGIYVFKKEVLFELLENTTYLDFGKEVIPYALTKYKTQAFPFYGYWEDIGTIRAFFEAHMALTREVPSFNFYDEDKPIFTNPRFLPPAKINGADIRSSIISEGSIIDHCKISDSVVGVRSIIRKDSFLERVIVMGNDFYESMEKPDPFRVKSDIPIGIGEGCEIRNAILDKNCRIGQNCRLINEKGVEEATVGPVVIKNGIIVVPKGAEIPPNTVI